MQQLDDQTKEYEQIVGLWNPLNKFMNLHTVITNLANKVSSIDIKSIDFVASKAKELNKELEFVENRLLEMKEIYYDKGKIDFLYTLTDKSQELEYQIQVLIERLKALERIHKESTDIESTLT